MLGKILGAVSAPLAKYLEGRQRLKEVKLEGKIALTKARYEAKAELMRVEAKAAADYDTAAQQNMKTSLKDEYLLIILTLPVIGSFIPGIQDYVLVGWDYLDKVPQWFQWSLIGVIASTFGLRWLFKESNPLKRKEK